VFSCAHACWKRVCTCFSFHFLNDTQKGNIKKYKQKLYSELWIVCVFSLIFFYCDFICPALYRLAAQNEKAFVFSNTYLEKLIQRIPIGCTFFYWLVLCVADGDAGSGLQTQQEVWYWFLCISLAKSQLGSFCCVFFTSFRFQKERKGCTERDESLYCCGWRLATSLTEHRM